MSGDKQAIPRVVLRRGEPAGSGTANLLENGSRGRSSPAKDDGSETEDIEDKQRNVIYVKDEDFDEFQMFMERKKEQEKERTAIMRVERRKAQLRWEIDRLNQIERAGQTTAWMDGRQRHGGADSSGSSEGTTPEAVGSTNCQCQYPSAGVNGIMGCQQAITGAGSTGFMGNHQQITGSGSVGMASGQASFVGEFEFPKGGIHAG